MQSIDPDRDELKSGVERRNEVSSRSKEKDAIVADTIIAVGSMDFWSFPHQSIQETLFCLNRASGFI